MEYSTLLMDADDTLFDFPECERRALTQALSAYGLEAAEDIIACFSAINSELWKCLERSEITRSELRVRRFRDLCTKRFPEFERSDELADKYVERLGCQAVLIKDAEKAVRALSEKFEIYIITNGITSVQKGRFALTDITSCLKGLFISDEIGVNKPSPEFFEYVFKNVREKDKRRMLVVGDSLTSDMQGGRNAGLDTCIYDPRGRITMPHPLCDYRIDDLMQLITLCRGEGI